MKKKKETSDEEFMTFLSLVFAGSNYFLSDNRAQTPSLSLSLLLCEEI